jgi:cell division septum initiation protein DivIVA
VPNQDHDAGVRSAAGDHWDDPAGRPEVPEQRSPSAARLLEMTARETDQWRSEARAEADAIVAAAREEADAMVRSAQHEVARLEQVAADHSQHMRRHLNDMLDRLDSAPAQERPGARD